MFDLCSHGNIGITCPQCKGRAPAAPGVSGFGLPKRDPADVPEYDESARTLNLGAIIDRTVTRVNQTGDRQGANVKAFWSQINSPTTVEEHQARHADS